MKSDLLIKVIDNKNNSEYFGGDQGWFAGKSAKGYGCGIIALVNVILTHKKANNSANTDCCSITKSQYMHLADKIRKRYLPIVPGFGINGFILALGANLYFLTHGIKAFARWGVMPCHLWNSVDDMLSRNWPVVLAIGPNNLILGKSTLTMHASSGQSKINSHYVTIVAADTATITVSSWGKRYTIYKRDYETYMKKTSNTLFSNILYIAGK